MGELAPADFPQVGFRALVRQRIAAGRTGDRAPDLSGADLAKMQVRRQSRHPVLSGPITPPRIVGQRGVEELLQSRPRARLAGLPSLRQAIGPADARQQIQVGEGQGIRPAFETVQLGFRQQWRMA